ncbi:molybdate ABC transporter permease subunit [Lentisalinibacter orientalis]|uniref:molybdate ABC transporter permease subunit n=1 Tax=Lentisalinibacter orientalis TaxID=2992241 RepID=UPI0038643B3E
MLSPADWDAARTTLLLAATTVVVLILVATPLAWRLAFARGRWARVAEAVVAMPLVLPPTVMGFYLLVLLGPAGPIGSWWVKLTGDTLSFSFTGLVIASCLHSLPFAVQPLQNAFESVGRRRLEAAASLRASPLDAFFSVALPLALRGYVTAAVLTFAHTLGEFGVMLMVGGNIPGRTRVLSISIFEHVETLDYAAAHRLAAALLIFSFVVLLSVYLANGRYRTRVA